MEQNKKGVIMKRIFVLSIVSIVILFNCCKRTALPGSQSQNSNASQTVAPAPHYEITFDPIIEFHGEAFPIKILSLASMNTAWDGSPRMCNEDYYIGDTLGDFGVSLTINSSETRTVPVRIEIESDKFVRRSVQEANIQTNKEIEIFPRIAYNYSALEHLIQPITENVAFRLYVDKDPNPVKDKLEIVRFHSVNEVPLAEISRWDDETIIDHSWLFAAYVNEDDPLIDRILQEALQIGTVEKIGFGNSFSFGGYQDIDGDNDTSLEVALQVLAIWSVFQRHNIRYSNITTTSTGNKFITTQYVRTLQESFGNMQANCVDGTVLFASVLRKLGIEPFLVVIPGHMFLGYDLNRDGTDYDFLETTMLGSEDITKYTKDDSLWGKLKLWSGLGKTQSTVSRDSFLAASAVARKKWGEVQDKIFDDIENDYQIIPISALRAAGVMPINRY
jgi:hypothetical protein